MFFYNFLHTAFFFFLFFKCLRLESLLRHWDFPLKKKREREKKREIPLGDYQEQLALCMLAKRSLIFCFPLKSRRRSTSLRKRALGNGKGSGELWRRVLCGVSPARTGCCRVVPHWRRVVRWREGGRRQLEGGLDQVSPLHKCVWAWPPPPTSPGRSRSPTNHFSAPSKRQPGPQNCT